MLDSSAIALWFGLGLLGAALAWATGMIWLIGRKALNVSVGAE